MCAHIRAYCLSSFLQLSLLMLMCGGGGGGGGGDAIFSATTVIEAILIAHLCLDKFDAIIDGYDLVKTRCREAALGYRGPSW
jgi:hypothetical protein